MSNDTFQTIAGVLGNVLEWYDFAIYGFFSDTIAQVFFPPSSAGHDNLIASYAVFGGAFLMRPLGGVVTGHIGDKYGRKRALVFSLVAMVVPTVAMGFLPTYQQIGGWSTALLVICRMLQGFSVGGQLPSSLVYTLETKPKEHWGYYGSFINMAANFGIILGNLVGALLRTLLTDDQLVQWGWRAAFISGIFILPVAIFLRLYGREHHPNEGEYDSSNEGDEANDQGEGISRVTASQQKHPLREAVKRENWPALFSSILVPMLYGGGYYISVVWMAIFMETLIDPSVNGAFWVNLAANCVLTLTSFLTGWLSDRVGRVKMMTFGAISVGIAGPFMVYIISWGKTVDALFAQMTLCFFLSFYCGPFCTWLVEKFPPKIRLTSMSLGFNLGICISSGFSPAIATALVRISNVAPGFIFPVFAALGLIGMFISTKIHQDGGADSDDDTQGKETNTQGDYIIEDDLSTHLL
mmetsp:Transcript_2917/g.5198  ORF Transcript_2917/g.5198 Transcript_2917/m.5198 type:complete len:467 (+) Transcript_2917:193-1593(+)